MYCKILDQKNPRIKFVPKKQFCLPPCLLCAPDVRDSRLKISQTIKMVPLTSVFQGDMCFKLEQYAIEQNRRTQLCGRTSSTHLRWLKSKKLVQTAHHVWVNKPGFCPTILFWYVGSEEPIYYIVCTTFSTVKDWRQNVVKWFYFFVGYTEVIKPLP